MASTNQSAVRLAGQTAPHRLKASGIAVARASSHHLARADGPNPFSRTGGEPTEHPGQVPGEENSLFQVVG
ncbi:MAG: hypothetical protein H0X07_01390 [Gemmatimonadales bacterium]|nr:hypothetical protein [Gemmatimonadales bacterium]